jgi:hypothetical protein
MDSIRFRIEIKKLRRVAEHAPPTDAVAGYCLHCGVADGDLRGRVHIHDKRAAGYSPCTVANAPELLQDGRGGIPVITAKPAVMLPEEVNPAGPASAAKITCPLGTMRQGHRRRRTEKRRKRT